MNSFHLYSNEWPSLHSSAIISSGQEQRAKELLTQMEGTNNSEALSLLINRFTSHERSLAAKHLLLTANEKIARLLLYLNEATRQQLFSSFDWTSELAEDYVKKVLDGNQSREEQQTLIEGVFNALPENTLSQIADDFFEHLQEDRLADFLNLFSSSEKMKIVLNQFFKTFTPRRFESCRSLILLLAKNFSPKNPSLAPALRSIIDFIPQLNDQWKKAIFEAIEPNRKSFPLNTIDCVLWGMNSELRNMIAVHYAKKTNILPFFLMRILSTEPEWGRQANLLSDFMLFLDEEGFLILFEWLRIKYPQALSYFLCSLSENLFNKLVSFDQTAISSLSHPKTKTRLLNSCPISPFFPEIAQELKVQRRLDPLFDIKLYLGPGEYSAVSLSELQRIEHPEASILQAIPPYLLALGLYDEQVRSFIFRFLPHWTWTQIVTIGQVMTLEQFEEALQNAEKKEAIFIAQSLRLDVLEAFCIEEREKINTSFEEFETRSSRLTQEVNALLEKNEKLTQEHYDALKEEAHQIRQILSKFLFPFGMQLQIFLLTFPENHRKAFIDYHKCLDKTRSEFVKFEKLILDLLGQLNETLIAKKRTKEPFP